MIALLPLSLQLKPPHVVAEFHSRHEAGLGELREVAVNRGPIKTPVGQRIGHFGVRLRPVGSDQMLHHRQPGGGASQASLSDPRLHGLKAGWVGGLGSSLCEFWDFYNPGLWLCARVAHGFSLHEEHTAQNDSE